MPLIDKTKTVEAIATFLFINDAIRGPEPMNPILYCMEPGRDLAIAKSLSAKLSCPHKILQAGESGEQIVCLVKRMSLVVSMRLHTLIFAARVAVPVAGLVYDPKVSSYLAELGMPCAGEVEHFEPDPAIACVDKLLADYETQQKVLAERSKNLTQAAGENERLLLTLLEGN